ncbi:Pet122p SCDLUD_001635 [Saccharomycodes ludwigii]|uniref:Pet122p n=1 Tax=Saccharomycodes ludwigii TaxID=36035 RepID=UPI001E83F080|nr:hypothetical protein SCDLUD_001635 [Saccharomycodes ludwigii]KAH3901852.1 hypothetical protein SCDLUD_001635 [Saccharomycodes ludwigii]
MPLKNILKLPSTTALLKQWNTKTNPSIRNLLPENIERKLYSLCIYDSDPNKAIQLLRATCAQHDGFEPSIGALRFLVNYCIYSAHPQGIKYLYTRYCINKSYPLIDKKEIYCKISDLMVKSKDYKFLKSLLIKYEEQFPYDHNNSKDRYAFIMNKNYVECSAFLKNEHTSFREKWKIFLLRIDNVFYDSGFKLSCFDFPYLTKSVGNLPVEIMLSFIYKNRNIDVKNPSSCTFLLSMIMLQPSIGLSRKLEIFNKFLSDFEVNCDDDKNSIRNRLDFSDCIKVLQHLSRNNLDDGNKLNNVLRRFKLNG